MVKLVAGFVNGELGEVAVSEVYGRSETRSMTFCRLDESVLILLKTWMMVPLGCECFIGF